jgi:uncharacterized protein
MNATERRPIGRPLAAKKKVLEDILRKMGKALVAFSGGVDSTFLLQTAVDVLGPDVYAVIAASETYPVRETRAARVLARRLKARHEVIRTSELENPEFVKNPPLRCYHCKKELWGEMRKIAVREGIATIVDGQNIDDDNDYRPGARASREMGILSPLKEAGLSKDDIRTLARAAGLPTWDKPSLACLASRFPYDTPIERATLQQVGAAEDYLRGLGFGQLRVRHHGSVARIELNPAEFSRLQDERLRRRIAARLKKLGYLYVTIDLTGYRTGSMNEGLTPSRKSMDGLSMDFQSSRGGDFKKERATNKKNPAPPKGGTGA